ncbi:hypothetical protein MY4824_009409 [Beauveria thailandica]
MVLVAETSDLARRGSGRKLLPQNTPSKV